MPWHTSKERFAHMFPNGIIPVIGHSKRQPNMFINKQHDSEQKTGARPQVTAHESRTATSSKQCRYGAHCGTKNCRFKHPPIENPTNQLGIHEKTTQPLVLNEEEEKFMEELEAQIRQENELNDLAVLIYFTPTPDPANPYWIETYPELGRFSTWDDAFDALLAHNYKLPETDGDEEVGPGSESEGESEFIPGRRNEEGQIIYPCCHGYCPAEYCRDKRREKNLRAKAERHRQIRIERRAEVGDGYDSFDYDSVDSGDCVFGYRGENDGDY